MMGALSVVCLTAPTTGLSQTRGEWADVSAQIVSALTHVDPIPGRGTATEVRAEQPVAMLHAGALGGRLRLTATLNLEGLTIPDGVLTLGGWGEGFNDRRHPHTYVHELMLSATQALGRSGGGARVSLAVGKGFVPFGSDDPMSRPAVRFPANHHWSQILERAVAILGAAVGPVTVEASLFNGDEPERPGQWPRIAGRFGDSWSARVLLSPADGLELGGSHAEVKSPEHRPGAGTDQRKWHASARLERRLGSGSIYALGEWAHTSEANGFFKFSSQLGEAAWLRGPHRTYYRFEQTERPEEERTLDPFRSLRPHLENSILGTTRWSVHTVGYGVRLDVPTAKLTVEPLIEAAYARVADRAGGIFQTASLYGRRTFWSLTVGARLATGVMHRMGRYGVSEGSENETGHQHEP